MGGLLWYENPLPNADPAKAFWKAHRVADHPTHDIELGDLDNDRRLDIITRNQSDFGHKTGNEIYIWRQDKSDTWTQKVRDCPHGEGLALGDIDRDGDLDIVIGGIWFENPGSVHDGRWQAHIDEMEDDHICETLGRGVEILTEILGCPPSCSAAPGWKCNDKVLLAKSQFPFKYNSDCRGESIFRPIVGGREIPQPQIPVTLPTYDEAVGRNGVTHGTYNDYMLALLDPQKLNVLTIHAEVEGIACLDMFEQFVKKALTKGASFVPLGVLLREYPETGSSAIVAKEIPGREGWICCQWHAERLLLHDSSTPPYAEILLCRSAGLFAVGRLKRLRCVWSRWFCTRDISCVAGQCE